MPGYGSRYQPAGGGTGTITGGTNLGGGDADVFVDVSGANLRFRTISGLGVITVVENGNVIEISSSAEANAGASNGGGTDVFTGLSGSTLQFDTLAGGGLVSIGVGSNLITLTVAAATAAEINTGTETGKAVTPDALAGSDIGAKSATIVSFESDASVTTGNGTIAFTIPEVMDGWNLIGVTCSVHTKGITGATDVQVRRRRAGTNADMLSTKVTIGDEFFASDGVIDGDNDDVAEGDQIYVDVDAVHSGTAPLGLSTVMTFQLP